MIPWIRKTFAVPEPSPPQGDADLARSVAYSAFIASGVAGVEQVSFREFCASLREAAPADEPSPIWPELDCYSRQHRVASLQRADGKGADGVEPLERVEPRNPVVVAGGR